MKSSNDLTVCKVFQRQQELRYWNQDIINRLKCLVLGVGGLGSTIAMDLCRLGVREIIIVDLDVVDEHNLNRQILYGKNHVRLPKVEAALEQINFHNVRPEKTVVRHFHLDALQEWQQTVQFIRECDVIFNTIDWGDYFDYVVCKVAEKYQKPLILGGTEPFYGHTVSYFLQGTRLEDVKYLDCHDLPSERLAEIKTQVQGDENQWDTGLSENQLP